MTAGIDIDVEVESDVDESVEIVERELLMQMESLSRMVSGEKASREGGVGESRLRGLEAGDGSSVGVDAHAVAGVGMWRPVSAVASRSVGTEEGAAPRGWSYSLDSTLESSVRSASRSRGQSRSVDRGSVSVYEASEGGGGAYGGGYLGPGGSYEGGRGSGEYSGGGGSEAGTESDDGLTRLSLEDIPLVIARESRLSVSLLVRM